MCGIIGVVNLSNPEPVDSALLNTGNEAQQHRGPDGSGSFVQRDVALAMRRLSIIDVAGGDQPMTNEDGTVRVVYNGEIYNHLLLREELEAAGHRFRTRADTEVLVHGYEQWGRDGLLERLRGMFAFAIWDGRGLFLARDRMGMKPLYYAEHRGRLYFGSEIRGVLLQSDMPRQANLEALGLYLRIGFVTAPHTMFQGIKKLPPAHYLWIQDGKVAEREYWTLSYEPSNRDSEAQIVEEFRQRLEDSVVSHLMSDVPLGALLSGGIDSTTAVALMTEALDEPVTTLTLGFEGAAIDEAAVAARSARELGTDHHSVAFSNDIMVDYPNVIRAQEEPNARPTDAALYDMFRACRELGLKVVIVGEGADELLGGYSWHQNGRLESWIAELPLALRRAFGSSARLRGFGQMGRSLLRSARGYPTSIHQRYAEVIGLNGWEVARSLMSSDARAGGGGDGGQSIIDGWERWTDCVRGQAEFSQLLWLQSRTRMPDLINHGLDRQSMAHSVEARPPYLDHRLWEFCAEVPNALKLRGSAEKYLLREAGRRVVPEAARTRPKAPLHVPFAQWIAGERLPEWAESALDARAVRNTGLLDDKAVRRLRADVQCGNQRNVVLLSAVLNLQAWAHEFLET